MSRTLIRAYGNAINVIHAITEYKRAGASAVVIEDRQHADVMGWDGSQKSEMENAHGSVRSCQRRDSHLSGQRDLRTLASVPVCNTAQAFIGDHRVDGLRTRCNLARLVSPGVNPR
ncbi:hypothetical protein [Bradyrhizobium sp. 197]|uniref:hypothetical protein n=1 Tax=Bradyrhizobium sp. 197 TaxID=2782663 RepID=UPI001FF7A313|nr:hypothetical protein [Bradyrhizobium sp. 197]